MRRDPEVRPIPTIVLSGSPYETDTLREHGIDPRCYLVKPLEFEAFQRALACIAGMGVAVTESSRTVGRDEE